MPSAHAELLTIIGSNDEMDILIAFDDGSNYIRADTDKGFYDFFESDLKMYKSGAFRLKHDGAILFAHPTSDTQYRIVFVTSEGVQRFNASTIVFEENDSTVNDSTVNDSTVNDSTVNDSTVNDSTVNDSTVNGTIYPKSSIGTDISNFYIPVITRNYEREPRIIVYLDDVSTIMVNAEYTPNIKIENQDFQKIPADINLKITRDGNIIKNISDSTKTGTLSPVINILDDYFTPGFCYTITVTATSGNHTHTVKDDFSVISTAKYWDSTANPISADGKCNK